MHEYVNSKVLEVYNCNPTTLVWICEHLRLFNYKWYNYSCRSKVLIAYITLYIVVLVAHIYSLDIEEMDTKG